MNEPKLQSNSINKSNINIHQFNQYHLKILDKIILKNLNTKVAFIDNIVHYIIEAGGKRLRPLIVIYMSQAMKNSEPQNNNYIYDENIYTLATIVEFIHTATLLHDDVVDESCLRRNKATVNEAFGNSAAVLVGDFLYSRSFEMMTDLNNLDIMQVLAKTTNVIAEGEVLQLINIANLDINLQTYLDVIYYKTAKLFEASCEIAIILQNNQLNLREQAKTYGKHLGCAFQLIDDYLDYAGSTDTLGKQIGDDLRQAKLTMPLIYLLDYGNEEQKKQISSTINKIKNNTANNQDLNNIIELVKNTDALEYTKNQAIIESNKAKKALDFLNDDNIYKQILFSICDCSIERIL